MLYTFYGALDSTLLPHPSTEITASISVILRLRNPALNEERVPIPIQN